LDSQERSGSNLITRVEHSQEPSTPRSSRLELAGIPHKVHYHHKQEIAGESDTYFDRDPKGAIGGSVSDCTCSSASQMGQDQMSFKVPCSLQDSGCSTRLCEVHLAVGKPLRPVPWSSSIIFKLPPGFGVVSLYPRIAIRRPTLSKRKLKRSFFRSGGADLLKKTLFGPGLNWSNPISRYSTSTYRRIDETGFSRNFPRRRAAHLRAGPPWSRWCAHQWHASHRDVIPIT
jgi:hypothetical protein